MSERRSEEHTSELQSRSDLVCRLLLEKKKKNPFPFVYSHPFTNHTCCSKRIVFQSVILTSLVIVPVGGYGWKSWELYFFFFFNDTATPEIYTLSLPYALPICTSGTSDVGANKNANILEQTTTMTVGS